MMMHKKLQKILAIALMTSFFSTSFIMGVSEAAPARHAGGQRPAQTQQVRPVHKSSSGHQARPAMHRSNPGHHGPAVRKNIPKQQGSGMHRSTQHHKAQPMMHKSGPAHHGPAVHKAPQHKAQPMMHKSGPAHHGPAVHKGGPVHHGPAIHKAPHHKGQPMMHRGGTIHHRGPVVVQRHHPAPPPPPPHHHHNDHRSMHSGDWIGALLVGGIIGAIIANNSHHKADTVEYVYAD